MINEYKKANVAHLTPEYVYENLYKLDQIVFEVTDSCNLNCTYCGYGELYSGYDQRNTKNMDFSSATALIDYMVNYWQTQKHPTPHQIVYISFYGGEPLINMPFIKSMVNYIEHLPELDRIFRFSMTTNAMLLDKHMEYLHRKNFLILISLDGNEYGHSYRIDHNGKNSFHKVYNNILLLKNTYPDYFNENIQFNSVLHNRNSALATTVFIKNNFDKTPAMSSLNTSGIREENQATFRKMFIQTMGSIKSNEEFEYLLKENYLQLPIINELMRDIFIKSGNVYNNYNDLLYVNKKKTLPTGTCSPFGKKMFLTVNNKILVCERIPQHFAVGEVKDRKVDLNIEILVKKYNQFYEKLSILCSNCMSIDSCMQCIFQIDNLLSEHPICHGFMTKKMAKCKRNRLMSFINKYPSVYKQIIKDVVIY